MKNEPLSFVFVRTSILSVRKVLYEADVVFQGINKILYDINSNSPDLA